ncbi:site-specific integrase [Comamonas aquatilis]|uniref:site-specific integrase n=1 Tax=Comamonas aquatilis TaxID=1778406 RepID=UPI0039F06595
MSDIEIPPLTFTGVPYGDKETPWTLFPLLYKGGAAIRANLVGAIITAGELGPAHLERLPLLVGLHGVIQGNITGGASKFSEQVVLNTIKQFFRWMEEREMSFRLQDIETTYLVWTDYLFHRVRTVRNLSEHSAYVTASRLGRYLDQILERRKPILLQSSLRSPPNPKSAIGTGADKQNLEHAFSFGAALLDICRGLDLNALWGPLPVRIHLRTGQTLLEYSMPGRREWPHPLEADSASRKSQERVKAAHHAKHEADRTLKTRYLIVNLRIEAELLVFIAQTGMNLSQAHQLRMDQYSYTSSTDGYQVRSYKQRRNGPVLFEIFSHYREMFEHYLQWRNAVFPNDRDGLLFPLIRRSRHVSTPPTFNKIQAACEKLNLRFIAPQALRKTRVNWLLRRSRDADLTAELDQHTKETLLQVYAEPSLQVAMTEVTRFWHSHDPAIAPPSPGICVGAGPKPLADIPREATTPDCITPAGCLWCEHQRDIDSFDHVWSLCSFRYLKTQEHATVRPKVRLNGVVPPHPAGLAIDRITEKLRFFKNSSEVRLQWVEEGLTRIEEGFFHPDWANRIETYTGA